MNKCDICGQEFEEDLNQAEDGQYCDNCESETLTLHNGDVYIYGDDIVFIDSEEECYHIDDCIEVKIRRASYEWMRKYDEGEKWNWCEGTAYSIDYLNDNFYWWESDDEWHSEPEPEDDDGEDNYDYHQMERHSQITNETKFIIGFEIEKDCDERNGIQYHDKRDLNDLGWIKENDGSLNYGFELVSPKLDLQTFDPDALPSIIKNAINDSISDQCGGHINISEKGVPTLELFDGISGYIPMIFSMYAGRLRNAYCDSYLNKGDQTIRNYDKTAAIRIGSDRIEFRLISAVRNMETLKFRTKLFRHMLENKNSDPFSVIIKAASDTPLHDILSTVYDADKLEAMLIRAIKYANNYGYVAGTEYTEDQVMRILSEMKQKKQTQN